MVCMMMLTPIIYLDSFTFTRINVILTSEDEVMNGFAEYTNSTFIWVDQNDAAIELLDSKDLISLQKNIFKQIKSDIKYKFEPHISLIYKIMPEYIKKEIIHSLHLQNTYKMNKVMAVRTDQNIVDWKIVAERDLYA